MKKIAAPSAPPYVWPIAVDPWQLSGPGGQGGGGDAYKNRGQGPPVRFRPFDFCVAQREKLHTQVVGRPIDSCKPILVEAVISRLGHAF